MKTLKIIGCVVFLAIALPAKSQDTIDKIKYDKYFDFYTNEELKQKIFNSEKQYKVIYLFDIGCSSYAIFPEVTKILKNKINVAFFPISGQDVSDDKETIRFFDIIENEQVIYRLQRPKRKKSPIQIINMFKYPHRFLKSLDLNIKYKNIGIGSYIILDEKNDVVFSTIDLYKKYANMSEIIYFEKLNEL
ncbi:MAG: hypothetical protein LBT56_04315 [Prevotellaceae bacterium]|jgi:hypothetical protein|nr:hypothetical protein [Prevotellaceae bacterium]